MSQAIEKLPQITGTQIISTIENMAGLGSIGRQVLSDLGIYKIDPEKNILSISDEGFTMGYCKGNKDGQLNLAVLKYPIPN